MMAGGGIVSFAQGGTPQGVSKAEIDAYRAKLGGTLRRMSDAEIADRIKKNLPVPTALSRLSGLDENAGLNVEPRPESMSPVGRVSSARMPGVRGMIPTSEATNALDVFAATNPIKPLPAAKKDDLGIAAALTDDDMGLPQGPLPNQAPPSVSAAPKLDEGGLPSLSLPQTAGAVTPVESIMPSVNETSSDAALRKGMSMSDDYLKRDETSAKYDEMLERLQAFEKENYSSDEDLTAFLIGTGGTGSIGSLVRGGAAAANESRNNRRKRLFDEFAMERNKMGDDAALGMKGLELANQLAADASANERNIRNSITTLTAEQMRQRGRDADRVVTVENNRLAALDAVAKNEIATARNEAINDSTRLSAAMKLSTEIAATRSAMVTAETERSQILQDLEIELADAVADEAKPEKINAINNNIRAEQQRIREVVELALNSERKDGQNYLELESMANTIMEELMQKGSGRSVEDVTNVTVD
jgi:hypothetical protein